MATEQTINLKMVWQNDTKGAVRYAEVLPNGKICQAPNEPGAVLGTQYIRQSAFADKTFPKELNVTISY